MVDVLTSSAVDRVGLIQSGSHHHSRHDIAEKLLSCC